ncbi:SsgA family sporulation/cell division regulator [Streptomyces sp. NPDC002740]
MNEHVDKHRSDWADQGFRPALSTQVRRLFTVVGPSWETCRFSYSVAEPFTVTVELHEAGTIPVVRKVSRHLLLRAADAPRGTGFYRVWPSGPPSVVGRSLYFSFVTSQGGVTFEADLCELFTWLQGTLDVVPSGSEHELVDWDAWERMFLH